MLDFSETWQAYIYKLLLSFKSLHFMAIWNNYSSENILNVKLSPILILMLTFIVCSWLHGHKFLFNVSNYSMRQLMCGDIWITSRINANIWLQQQHWFRWKVEMLFLAKKQLLFHTFGKADGLRIYGMDVLIPCAFTLCLYWERTDSAHPNPCSSLAKYP